MYVRNSDHYLLEGVRSEFVALAREWAESARQAGAGQFDVMEGLVDPRWIAIIEGWGDRAVYDEFMQGTGAVLAERLAKLVDPSRHRVSQCVNVEPEDAVWMIPEIRKQPEWVDFEPVYIHNTWIYMKPGTVDEALVKINDEVRLAKKRELGILRFDVHKSLEDENLIHTYEVYSEQAAHLHHYDQSYLKKLYEDVVLTMFDYVDETRGHEYRPIVPDISAWMGWS